MHSTKTAYPLRQLTGLILGPCWLLVPLFFDAPSGMSEQAWVVANCSLFMVTWWIFEAIPIPVTSLLPLTIFPLFGGIPIAEAAAPYAHPLVFLFLGGFFIATAMVKWNLHKRMALAIILRTGTSPGALILGFMVATAFISMWVSNTATTVMMLPVAMSVVIITEGQMRKNFAVALLLSIAYSANIGGMGTLIGTPPNAFMAAFLENEYGYSISFARWMLAGVPIVGLGIIITYIALTKVSYPIGSDTTSIGRDVILDEMKKLGPISLGERLVAFVFASTALLWITRPLLVSFIPNLTDAGIAMLGGLALFLLPVDLRAWKFAHTWKAANTLPWGIILLFGGGLSLASALSYTGVSAWIADKLGFVEALPALGVILAIATAIIFLTEMTSNTATTVTFLPLLAALALGIGESPLLLALPATLAASCAFMLPVATAPNAVIYGSDRITIPQMAKAGLLLNFLFIAVVTVMSYTLVLWIFDIQVGLIPDWAL